MAKPRKSTATLDAIAQTRPFRSPGHEAVVALLLAADAVRRRISEVLAQAGDLTPQQYNVLRILRGAQAEGLATLAIADRMIERTPGITRLLDRLEAKGLVERIRTTQDRRQVLCRLTGVGRDLLGTLDQPIDQADASAVSGLEEGEIHTLIQLLERITATTDRSQEPLSN